MATEWQKHGNFEDVAQRYIFDDDKIVRHNVQDIEPAIDANTRLRNETGGWTEGRRMRKAASIPATVYYDWIVEWQREGLLPDMTHPEFSQMANALCLKRVRDGDYSKFRI